MRHVLIPRKGIPLLLLIAFQFSALFAGAQTHYSGSAIDLLISGTSTLHDWTMKSAKADCSANFMINSQGQITGVDNLVFNTPATGLKSEHSGMENNAYKALKTEKNPLISFLVTGITTGAADVNGTTVTCTGKLSIAGSSREESIIALCKLNGDNTISVSGTEKISMKDFQIDPPTFMLGTIKTGNEVVLTFHLTLKKS